MNTETAGNPQLTRFAWLSIAGAIATIILKTVAWLLTGSVGLLSDALESLVNLVGGCVALGMLTVAANPEDEDHPYGHGKAEYFSSGMEGGLIVVAAICIAVTAFPKLLAPQPLEQVGLGLAVSLAASLVNFLIARVLLKAARDYQSISLEANANHLMTDVWTSVGVVAAIGGVTITGWNRLDPLIALIVAANIIFSGFKIIRKSIAGLMDSTWEKTDLELFLKIIEPFKTEGITWHGLRTRQAGGSLHATIHILVPDEWTVLQGHKLLERLESAVGSGMPRVFLFTHLEPLNDRKATQDIPLIRSNQPPAQDSPPPPAEKPAS